MIEVICWVLIHSLWQGLLLALAGGGVIFCTRRMAAAVRYQLLCGLFFLFLAVVGMTFFYEWGLISASGKGDEGGGVGVSAGWLGDFCFAHAGQVVVIWLVVAAVKSLRLAAGWGYMRTIRRDGIAASALWVERVGALSRRLGIRRTVKMVESGLVRVPMVMGQLRPVIFIPLGLINHLPAGEMEAVVLHELAHIRRRDQLVNIIQQVMECLFFFNPGLLWISSLIRDERENCCDDVAIQETRDRVGFVRALVRFKEHSLREVTLAFPGNRRQLFHRVLRISRQENRGLGGRERMVLLVSGGLLLLWLAAVKGVGSAVKPVGYPVAVTKAAPVPAEVVSVLKARQQVTENMEWVETQLAELHKMDLSSQKRERSGKAGQVEKNREQVTRNQVQVEINLEQDIRNREQTGINEGQVEKNMVQDRSNLEGEEEFKRLQLARKAERAQRNLEQAQRNDEQARRSEEQDRHNREQAENKAQELKNRQEAERNRMQAELDRQQAERDREQADRDKAQADRDRVQADRDRVQAEQDREQAELDRQQAARERVQGERDRQQALLNRQQAEKERKQVEMVRVQAGKDVKQAELVRVLAEREKAEALGRADSKREVKN